MTPGTLDLIIYKGTTFTRTLTCLDEDDVAINLTGYTVQADVRKKPHSTNIEFDLNAAISDPTGGVITLTLTDTQTDDLEAGFYGWDLVLENDDDERLGPFIVGGVNVKEINSHLP